MFFELWNYDNLIDLVLYKNEFSTDISLISFNTSYYQNIYYINSNYWVNKGNYE